MPIKINVSFNEKEEVKALGAWWFAEEKTWVIPDNITDINPFMKWLPKEEGYIIKGPHLILRSSRHCWKCNQETPLIALGSRQFYSLQYETETNPAWEKVEDDPVLFTGIDYLDPDFANILQKQYPFFKPTYSRTAGQKSWANTCRHCRALQGDNYIYMEENIFSPINEDDARLIKRDYLKLKFDYYLKSGTFISEANEWLIQ